MEKVKQVEVMDTTLRDGEQSPGKNYNPGQKLRVVQFLLTQVGVDRVEVTSALLPKSEQEMLTRVMAWAQDHDFADQIEVLGFIDHTRSVDWITKYGGKVINLLGKGSRLHCREQLDQSLEQHLAGIAQIVEYAVEKGLTVNIYLEDWSQGMLNSSAYVEQLIAGLVELPIKRMMLCDTMGVLNPWQTEQFVNQVARWQPKLILDFHGHGDYGLATANTLFAVKTGNVNGVHVSVNSLGERAGNAALDQVVVNINDHLEGVQVGVDETKFRVVSQMVALISGRRIPANQPIVGDVFTNTAGVHADGDRKGKKRGGRELYKHPILTPERFGAVLRHSLGKLSGKASIRSNAERLGFALTDKEVGIVLKRVHDIGEEGKPVTMADLPYIIAEVLNRPEYIVFEVIDAHSNSRMNGRAVTSAMIKWKGKTYEIAEHGDGGFDAFMNALRKWGRRRKVSIPKLVDWDPVIPPGGTSGALVQANVLWRGDNGEGEFPTIGIHPDQTMASIKAAEAAINVCNQSH